MTTIRKLGVCIQENESVLLYATESVLM